MQRKVEGLENLNNILTLPIGSKFGLFVDSHMFPCLLRILECSHGIRSETGSNMGWN